MSGLAAQLRGIQVQAAQPDRASDRGPTPHRTPARDAGRRPLRRGQRPGWRGGCQRGSPGSQRRVGHGFQRLRRDQRARSPCSPSSAQARRSSRGVQASATLPSAARGRGRWPGRPCRPGSWVPARCARRRPGAPWAGRGSAARTRSRPRVQHRLAGRLRIGLAERAQPARPGARNGRAGRTRHRAAACPRPASPRGRAMRKVFFNCLLSSRRSRARPGVARSSACAVRRARS